MRSRNWSRCTMRSGGSCDRLELRLAAADRAGPRRAKRDQVPISVKTSPTAIEIESPLIRAPDFRVPWIQPPLKSSLKLPRSRPRPAAKCRLLPLSTVMPPRARSAFHACCTPAATRSVPAGMSAPPPHFLAPVSCNSVPVDVFHPIPTRMNGGRKDSSYRFEAAAYALSVALSSSNSAASNRLMISRTPTARQGDSCSSTCVATTYGSRSSRTVGAHLVGHAHSEPHAVAAAHFDGGCRRGEQHVSNVDRRLEDLAGEQLSTAHVADCEAGRESRVEVEALPHAERHGREREAAQRRVPGRVFVDQLGVESIHCEVDQLAAHQRRKHSLVPHDEAAVLVREAERRYVRVT